MNRSRESPPGTLVRLEEGIAGAVLAGGASTRMGQPKQSVALDGERAMIEFVIDALAAVCRRVVIVGKAGSAHARGGEVIDDLRPGLGPMGGIESLLASGIASQYLVCPCDVPFITSESLGLLLADTKQLATVFRREGAGEVDPLPARISAGALPVVSRLLDRGRRSVYELMRELGASEITMPRSREPELLNVNTPADFAAAQQRLALIQHAPRLQAARPPGRPA